MKASDDVHSVHADHLRARESLTVTFSADELEGIVGYLADGLGEEHRRLVQMRDDCGGGLSPAEWALLPHVVHLLSPDDADIAREILAKVKAT